VKPRLPTLPIPELSRSSHSEGFESERLHLLKKLRQITLEESMHKGDAYKDAMMQKQVHTVLKHI
jgi:hypothetical protein